MVSLMRLQLRLSEWQLAQLRKREQDMQDQEAYLIGVLNGAPPAGSSIESVSRRLNATGVGARAAQEQAARQRARVQSQSMRVKQLEEVASATLSDMRRDAEKRVLEDVLLTASGKRPWESPNGIRK